MTSPPVGRWQHEPAPVPRGQAGADQGRDARCAALLGERRVRGVSAGCVRIFKNVCVSIRCSGRLVMFHVRGVSWCVFETSGVATLKQLSVG
jgi:hypothetical protein